MGLLRQTCRIPGDLLNNGRYYIWVAIVKDTSVILRSLNNVVSFEVLEPERTGKYYGRWQGTVRPRLPRRSEYLGEAPDVSGIPGGPPDSGNTASLPIAGLQR